MDGLRQAAWNVRNRRVVVSLLRADTGLLQHVNVSQPYSTGGGPFQFGAQVTG
jgi:hypothetical protein